MARLRFLDLATGAAGSTVDAALSGSHNNSTTTLTLNAALTYANGTAVPTIAAPDYVVLVILDANGHVAEVVKGTAYTTGGTSITVTRAQEGTAAVSHASGAKVRNAPTPLDASAEDRNWYIDARNVINVTSLYTTSGGTWFGGTGGLSSSGAQNDAITFWGWWGPGTYSIEHYDAANGNRAIVTWAIENDDGTYTDLTTVDWSSGAALRVVSVTLPSGVASVKRRRLRAKAATKNAGASAYYMEFLTLQVVKTAD